MGRPCLSFGHSFPCPGRLAKSDLYSDDSFGFRLETPESGATVFLFASLQTHQKKGEPPRQPDIFFPAPFCAVETMVGLVYVLLIFGRLGCFGAKLGVLGLGCFSLVYGLRIGVGGVEF